MTYHYPDNLKAKPVLWLWELKHIVILGVCLLLSVLALSQLGIFSPLVCSAVLAFLTIRVEDTTILDYIKSSVRFFITNQQVFYWEAKK